MKKKHYLVYQTTNLLNGKIYIGQHQTDNLNDGYIGSGVELNLDIKKFGKNNFKREILFDFDSFEEMDNKERELVNEDFVARSDTYNLCVGGRDIRGNITFLGKHHTEETRRKISEAKSKNPQVGDANGMFNRHWYYNPTTLEQKPFFEGEQPLGWIRGHIQVQTNEVVKQREIFKHATDGLVRAWNTFTLKTRYFKPGEELPDGWVFGAPSLSEETKDKISKATKEAMWKNRDINSVIKYYNELYSAYLVGGFQLVKTRFDYKYSLQNLVQQFKKYIPEFKPQRGKKRI